MVEQPENQPAPQRDWDEVLRFIERFGTILSEAGMGRMPARVFTALLAEDSGKLTAAELADRLQVSPGAVSGAVRYLAQLNMIRKEREPGARRDHYVLHDDTWYAAVSRRDQQTVRSRRGWARAVTARVQRVSPASR